MSHDRGLTKLGMAADRSGSFATQKTTTSSSSASSSSASSFSSLNSSDHSGGSERRMAPQTNLTPLFAHDKNGNGRGNNEIINYMPEDQTGSSVLRARKRAAVKKASSLYDSDLECGAAASNVSDASDGGKNESSPRKQSFGMARTESSGSTTISSSSSTNQTLLPITWTLPLLVFVDMLSVSLVLPIMFQYFKQAGVTSAHQRELLSSLFSISQIVGGICMGIFRDALGVSSRTLLFFSFGGSAVSYAMIAYSSSSSVNPSSLWGLWILMASRILVGFVKQTMTVVTTLLTTAVSDSSSSSSTTSQNYHSEQGEENDQSSQHPHHHHGRAKYMGRLKASSTMAWIAGPSIGALLYKYVHPQTPALLASSLFIVNIGLMTILLPASVDNQHGGKAEETNFRHNTPSDADGHLSSASRREATWIRNGDSPKSYSNDTNGDNDNDDDNDQEESDPSQPRLRNSTSSLRLVFGSWSLATVVMARLLFMFVSNVTSTSQLGSFFEEMYQLQSPHYRGYITSYNSLLQFVVQGFLVHPILRFVGGGGGDRRSRASSSSSDGGHPKTVSSAESSLRITTYTLSFLMAVSLFVQSRVQSLFVYLALIAPVSSLCLSMMRVSLETLTTQVAPQSAMFSVLAALDILQNMVGVTVPFYRTGLFRLLTKTEEDSQNQDVNDELGDSQQQQQHLMEGDPEPQAWLVSSGFHWLMAAVAMTLLLFSFNTTTRTQVQTNSSSKIKGR